MVLQKNVSKIVIAIYVGLLLFWFYIKFLGLTEGFLNNLFGALYPAISIIGAICGLYLSKKWGGIRSVMGRGILFISLGLIGEAFGQLVWTYFTMIREVEVPYPSIADIGYFSIIPFYALAMFNFARAAGVKVNIKSFKGKLQSVAVPLVMVLIAYILFLKNVEIDLDYPLRTFLDFGYPGFEAIAVSIGLLTYSLSRGVLGGIMKNKILFLVFALMLQYITDYTFLYRAGLDLYYNGGLVDLMYATSLTIMTLGILSFDGMRDKTVS